MLGNECHKGTSKELNKVAGGTRWAIHLCQVSCGQTLSWGQTRMALLLWRKSLNDKLFCIQIEALSLRGLRWGQPLFSVLAEI